jgi:chemotaxis protein CheX
MSDYLRFFTEALREIVTEIGFQDLAIDYGNNEADAAELVASVGITGDLQGFMMLRTNMESAKSFVSKMLSNMGVEDEEEGFGQFHKEAIGEIVNQVSGRSTMMLADQQIDCNITPPTIIAGHNIYSDVSSCESSLSHTISGSFGNISLFVGIKKSQLEKINS